MATASKPVPAGAASERWSGGDKSCPPAAGTARTPGSRRSPAASAGREVGSLVRHATRRVGDLEVGGRAGNRAGVGIEVAVPAVAGVVRSDISARSPLVSLPKNPLPLSELLETSLPKSSKKQGTMPEVRLPPSQCDGGRRVRGDPGTARAGSPTHRCADPVPDDRVVAAAGDDHAGPAGPTRRCRPRHVRVVVVVDEVVAEDRARAVPVGPLRRRARAALRRRCVVVVLAVREDAGLVVVPLGVLDDQMAARVRARVAERGVLRRARRQHHVAVRARADVVDASPCCWRRCGR